MRPCSDRRTTAVPSGRKWPKAMAWPEYPNSAYPLHTRLRIASYLSLYFYVYTVYFWRLRLLCTAPAQRLGIRRFTAPPLQNEFVASLKLTRWID